MPPDGEAPSQGMRQWTCRHMPAERTMPRIGEGHDLACRVGLSLDIAKIQAQRGRAQNWCRRWCSLNCHLHHHSERTLSEDKGEIGIVGVR